MILPILWDEHLDVQPVALLLLWVVFSIVPGIGPKRSREEFISVSEFRQIHVYSEI